MLKKFIIGIYITVGLYLIISYLLLDGRLTYWTSFNESTIKSSKEKKLFISDKLNIYTEGDSLKKINEKFDIWINKRYEIKYYGILLYWTFENPNWRYLNIEKKQNYIQENYCRKKIIINSSEIDYMKNFTGGWEPCCNSISCEIGDTITIEFTEFRTRKYLGKITAIIR